MLSPARPPGPALGPALREGLKLGPGPGPTFKAQAQPGLVFLKPNPSLVDLNVDNFELWMTVMLAVEKMEQILS